MKQTRDERVHVKVTGAEKQAMTDAAQAAGLTLSAWLRFTLLAAIRKGKTPHSAP